VTASNSIPKISATKTGAPPEWATLERTLFSLIDDSALEFADRYTNSDNTLIWRSEWPGFDGSDDPYEGFMNFTLHYIMGGDAKLDKRHREIWDAITWQWTEYGQVVDEFDEAYDWMHHGEALLGFYWMALANPHVLKDRQRTKKFAALYTGENKEVDNWDPEHKIIKAPINGSGGAHYIHTWEDWGPNRQILEEYLPPFEDITGQDPYQKRTPWHDDQIYREILEKINEHMGKGDVPVNLTSTGLATHAYMYDHDPKYKEWALAYLAAWEERTARNGGIIPDNIGLDGEIGTYNDGKWWGGYYGWRWPHGALTILEPLTVAGANAVLLSRGDMKYLDLARSQIDLLWEMRIEEDGEIKVPNRHFDAGWRDYRIQRAIDPIILWNISLDEADAQRVERGWHAKNEELSTEGYVLGSARPQHTAAWFAYIRGYLPDYPTQILKNNLEAVNFQIKRFRSEEWNPYTMDHYREAMSIHDWQILQPAILEALIHLTLGGPMPAYHGGHLHTAVRYFDIEGKRPGLPTDVAALVEKITSSSIELTLVNTSSSTPHSVVIQAGAFGEHRILTVTEKGGTETPVGGNHLHVDLPADGTISLILRVERFANDPTYEGPFTPEKTEVSIPATIIGRDKTSVE
jgi:hypothetical protein